MAIQQVRGCLPMRINQWQLTKRERSDPDGSASCSVFLCLVATMPRLWMQANKPQHASNQIHMWLDRMSQTHRTSRSKAVKVLKLAHMPDEVLKAAMLGIVTPTVGQMIKCDSSQWQINRESSSALQFCSALCSILVSLSLLFWFSHFQEQWSIQQLQNQPNISIRRSQVGSYFWTCKHQAHTNTPLNEIIAGNVISHQLGISLSNMPIHVSTAAKWPTHHSLRFCGKRSFFTRVIYWRVRVNGLIITPNTAYVR